MTPNEPGHTVLGISGSFSSFERCTIDAGHARWRVTERIRYALRGLRGPRPVEFAVYHAGEKLPDGGWEAGPTLISVGADGRISVGEGGHLTLGPGCVIRNREGDGFVIECPPSPPQHP